jgi:hypothetical protein
MHFMLVFKNLFSFYVEFEILSYFLLFCRLLSVNKGLTWEIMLGTRWVGLTRRNQVKNISIQKLRTAIIKLRTANSLWFILEKMQKLWTTILELWTANVGLETRNCSFKAIFSLELIDFDTPSPQTSLNCLERISKARKKRKNTIRGRIWRRTQEPGEKSYIFLVYYFLYSFLMLYCCLNINLDTIFDMIYG